MKRLEVREKDTVDKRKRKIPILHVTAEMVNWKKKTKRKTKQNNRHELVPKSA